MSEMVAIYILALMNVAQLVGWSVCMHKLVNKLMSKNFAEYDHISRGPAETLGAPEFSDYEEEIEEREILGELNGLLKAQVK